MPKTDQNPFKIAQIVHENGTIKALFDVNFEDEIFKGHFPNQPVVPGACLLQLVKEVLEEALQKTLQLKKASQLKFISMVMPGDNNLILELSYKLTENKEISIVGKLTNCEAVSFKFQGSFVFNVVL
jgi:3-hydroxyacyl-[acyl-carrier-protein] dehydratase